MASLAGKTLFITGASRGIGKAIGLRAARDGANIVIAAKSAEPHPKLAGTIYSAAEEMVAVGGAALPVVVDVRSDEMVESAVAQAVERFGGIDILVNNASAISLTGTLATPMKRVDLMHQVNTRGTYLCSRVALPHLLAAENPHILTLSPPPTLEPRWYAPYLAYTMAKMGMSLCVLGMAAEFADQGVAVNALWPRTTIATAAVRYALGGESMIARSRTPAIVADAAHLILTRDSRRATGQFFIDDELLRASGVDDLTHYQVDPTLDESELVPDLFL